jgi:hypothetical protein
MQFRREASKYRHPSTYDAGRIIATLKLGWLVANEPALDRANIRTVRTVAGSEAAIQGHRADKEPAAIGSAENSMASSAKSR